MADQLSLTTDAAIDLYKTASNFHDKDKTIKELYGRIKHKYSSISRFIAYKELKYRYPLYRASYIHSTLCVESRDLRFNYGMTYSMYDELTRAFNHIYVCISPTLVSMDGEYRKRLLHFDQLAATRAEYPQLFAVIENFIDGLLSDGAIVVSILPHFPFAISSDEKLQRKFQQEIDASGIAKLALVSCIIADMFNFVNGTIENHIDAAYRALLFNRELFSFYKDIVATISPADEFRIQLRLSQYYGAGDDKDVRRCHVGQKIIPLRIREVVELEDITHQPWREYYFNIIASDIMLNLIFPGIPLIGYHTFLQGIGVDMFDNPEMLLKFNHSAVAKAINDKLLEAERTTIQDDDFINDKFYKLAMLVDYSIKYSESHLEMSKIALCFTNEYLGRTFADVPSLSQQPVGSTNSFIATLFTDEHKFAKILFDYIYGIYCLHDKCQIIHTDLHMNNITLYQSALLYSPANRESLAVRSGTPSVLYMLDAENTFKFDYYGYIGTIIDFSRGLTADRAKISRIFSADITNRFFRAQHDELTGIIRKYFNTIAATFRNEIIALIDHDYTRIFNLCKNIDYFIITGNIIKLLSMYEKMQIHPRIMQMLQSIHNRARNYFVSTMEELVKSDVEPQIVDLGREFLCGDLFAAYRCEPNDVLAAADDYVICDIFNFETDIKYSSISADTIPKQLKIYKPVGEGEEEDDVQNVFDIIEKDESKDIQKFLQYSTARDDDIPDILRDELVHY